MVKNHVIEGARSVFTIATDCVGVWRRMAIESLTLKHDTASYRKFAGNATKVLCSKHEFRLRVSWRLRGVTGIEIGWSASPDFDGKLSLEGVGVWNHSKGLSNAMLKADEDAQFTVKFAGGPGLPVDTKLIIDWCEYMHEMAQRTSLEWWPYTDDTNGMGLPYMVRDLLGPTPTDSFVELFALLCSDTCRYLDSDTSYASMFPWVYFPEYMIPDAAKNPDVKMSEDWDIDLQG